MSESSPPPVLSVERLLVLLAVRDAVIVELTAQVAALQARGSEPAEQFAATEFGGLCQAGAAVAAALFGSPAGWAGRRAGDDAAAGVGSAGGA